MAIGQLAGASITTRSSVVQREGRSPPLVLAKVIFGRCLSQRTITFLAPGSPGARGVPTQGVLLASASPLPHGGRGGGADALSACSTAVIASKRRGSGGRGRRGRWIRVARVNQTNQITSAATSPTVTTIRATADVPIISRGAQGSGGATASTIGRLWLRAA